MNCDQDDKKVKTMPLLVDQQLCFALYSANLAMNKVYRQLLSQLDMTYPQYLVLLVLWEQDGVPLSHIVDRLGLNTNTLTPLLKRLEAAGFVTRTRGTVDSRQVILWLTPQAKALREEAEDIPSLFSCKLRDAGCAEGELSALREQLDHLISRLETLTQTAGV